MRLLKQSSTAQPLVFLLVSSTDHVSGVTGASPTVTLSKSGGAFASPAGSVTEIGSGWYKVAGNATDTATLGPLLLHATASGADPCDVQFDVVAFDPQSATNLGLSGLPAANPGASGGLPTVDASNGVKLSVGTGTGQLNVSGGKAPVTLNASDVTGNVPANMVVATATVTLNATQGSYAPAQAGDAMSLTSGERTTLAGVIWNSLTSGMSTAGSIGLKLTNWVLGSDSKALLSTDAQTGVTIPTVTTVGTTTNLTNAPTAGDFTSTMKTSLGTAITNANLASASALASAITSIESHGDTSWTTASGFATSSALSSVATIAAAIESQTDKLTFDDGNNLYVDVNAISGSGIHTDSNGDQVVSLSSIGLDEVSIVMPSGDKSSWTFPQRLMAMFARLGFNKNTAPTSGAGNWIVYADDNSTQVCSLPITNDGTTQTFVGL